jgi:hypothetical protein
MPLVDQPGASGFEITFYDDNDEFMSMTSVRDELNASWPPEARPSSDMDFIRGHNDFDFYVSFSAVRAYLESDAFQKAENG